MGLDEYMHRYIGRYGERALPADVDPKVLINEKCEIADAGEDYIEMVCGEWRVTVGATIGVGDIVLEIYANRERK